MRKKLIMMVFVPCLLIAGTVGKISGRIIDAATNEPLVGVDVVVSGLMMGGASDAEGYYFILNVPPGEYTIEASMIGYRAEIRREVKVFTDRTTNIDFRLNTAIIELETPVIVLAKKPVIEIDMTSKESRVTSKELAIMPVETANEVLALQGGVTKDAAGDLHVRGGRSGELAYYVDGVEISNPLLGTTPEFHKNIVSEMSLLSGTFNAEYGNVMSGVVNVVTPDGGERLTSGIEYTSLALNRSPYRKKDWMNALDSLWFDAHRDSADTSLYEVYHPDVPFLGEVNAHVAGPFFFDRNLRFYLFGNYSNQESALPFGYSLDRAVNGKLTKKISPGMKIFVDAHYLYNEVQHYNHLYKYIYYDPDSAQYHCLVNYNTSIGIIGGMNHAPTNAFFYNVRIGFMVDSIKTQVPGLEEDRIIEPVWDNSSEFYLSGYPVYRQTATTKQYVFKIDCDYHFAKIHNAKWGIEHNFYHFNLQKREQIFVFGPILTQNYIREPMDGALFLQDKIEHKYLVMNVGLRFDYCYPKASMWEDIEDPTSRVADVAPHYQLSPRLGLSHPITTDAMLHFAYGHFFQMPSYDIMYYNSNYIAHPESIPRYGLVGNPRIQPQRTTAYEVGVKYALYETYGIDVTLFLKDIKNLLATTQVRIYPYDYIIYTNEDFGSVQGIDMTFKREIVSNLGFAINYTYQIARGNRSFAMQGFYDVYTGMPERMKEYFLDFDRRHTFAARCQILFGTNGGIGLNFTAASGLPYTPYISEGVVVEENSARMGWEYSFDVMLHQGIKVGSHTMEFFVMGTNITDHLNPRYVYRRSGEPWNTGEPESGLMGSMDYIMNPARVGPRRVIRAGIKIEL